MDETADRTRALVRGVPWLLVVPVVALLALAATWGRKPGDAVLFVVAIVLAGAVLTSVHHAEVVAHRVGEPLGSLILAVAVTVIEAGLIVTLMASGGSETDSLARDTVFAAAMITCNGVVGLCLVVSTLRRHVASFNAEGTATAFATVVTLATLCLVLPAFTTSSPGPTFTWTQLTFAAIASIVLYALFVFAQTVRHRDFFLWDDEPATEDVQDDHAPSDRAALISVVALVLSLVAVIGLAKVESPAIENAVDYFDAPQSAVGVAIALLVLLPETLAAYRNARRDRLQTSFNLAYGSAVASIGLTIPTIAVASIWLDGSLLLGLSSLQITLLGLTAVVGALTILPGRATLQEGGLHLAIFAGFLVFALNP
jgi:Ca2+:H+ antiporter